MLSLVFYNKEAKFWQSFMIKIFSGNQKATKSTHNVSECFYLLRNQGKGKTT